LANVDLNEALVAQVRQSADIVEFINNVTPLKVAGRSHKGLCPFHREKSPSFNVDRAKGLFYCFGCGTGGDVFKFLMLTERFNFPEAVEYVANRVGIELPKRNTKRDEGRDLLLELLDEASLAYHQALGWTPNPAVEYLRKREVSDELSRKYGFGYAPDSWDYLITRLGRKYTTQDLERAGLVLPRKSGGGFYDRFRNRLMIPIHSDTGSLIGFGGRTLDGSDPKYLNSPESAVFNKSNLLYNLHRSRDQMRRIDRAILVEGYFDCIALDNAGVPGVVASMGTSLTPGQASVMRRYARQVVICYDGDEAGRNAALRAAPILLAAGIAVRVLDVGTGHDPDTFLKTEGFDRFMELLGNAREVVDFAIERWITNPASMDSRAKSEAVEKFVPLLAAMSDPVVKNDSAQRVADLLRLQFEAVWGKVRGKREIAPERERTASAPNAEKFVLKALLQDGADPELMGKLTPEHFDDPACRAIFALIQPRLSSSQPLDFSEIATHLRGEAELTRLSELALGDEDSSVTPQSLESTIRLMELNLLENRLKQLTVRIAEAEREGNSERVQLLDQEKTGLMRQKIELSRLRAPLK
jgi:DNA primase